EYSAKELPTPRIRVSNYAPTSVPIQLKKHYGFAGKLADGKEGIRIDIYKNNSIIQSISTRSYGYFQVFGLEADSYTLKAKGYETKSIDISDDFVMQLLLQPLP